MSDLFDAFEDWPGWAVYLCFLSACTQIGQISGWAVGRLFLRRSR